MSQRTTILIVGAGPTGLAAAISLAKQNFHDFLILEESRDRGQASRAITIHAATLEALDSIGCADALVASGIKGTGMQVSDRRTPLMSADFASLAPYTKFPFVLITSQTTTERILEAHLKELGVSVIRPEKAIGLKYNDGELVVTFESGKVIMAQYVLGADGARSVIYEIRQMAGVDFVDPDGAHIDERLAQMILADVSFSSTSPQLPTDQIHGTGSDGKFFLLAPLPRESLHSEAVYRIGFNVPLSAGPPPSNPPTSYLQQYLNEQGPLYLSSDPSVNPNHIHISKTIWSTRFRTHAAIAEKFLVRFGSQSSREHKQPIVVLVGDAAHIHAPAGGLGMNIGIRDAIFIGPALAAHATSDSDSLPLNDHLLVECVATRRARALSTIQLTKRIMSVLKVFGIASGGLININYYWLLRLIGMIPFFSRQIAWNLSGLGNR